MTFRRQALRQLRAPEQLHHAVRLATAPMWLLTGALTAIVVVAGAWATIGTVPRTVDGPGVLLHSNGISAVDAATAGQVVKVWMTANQRLVGGTPMYSLQQADGHIVHVNAPWDANVVTVLISEGQLVQPGNPVAEMERLDTPGDALRAVVFVRAVQAPSLQPGMPARISVAAAPSTIFGTVPGVVTAVGAFPETEESIRAFLGRGQTVAPILAHGSVVRVTVTLESDPSSANGLRWSKASPPFRLTSVSQVTAAFTVAEEHPITWLLGR
jgi:multidrug resistance efflux pump